MHPFILSKQQYSNSFRDEPVPFFYTGFGTGFLAQKTGGSGSGSGFQKQHISPRGALQNSNDTFAGLEEWPTSLRSR